MKLKRSDLSNYIAAIFFTAILLIPALGQSQQVMTLDEAIDIAVENNFNIELSRNRLNVAENNRSLGNAGFLPTLDLTGSRVERVEDSEFEAGGDRETTTGARSSTTNASLNFEWTLFDGLQMFSEFDRLDELKNIADREMKLEAEFLVADVILTYFDIVRIKEQIRVLQNTVDVSTERIEIEETKFDLGSGSEVELLQARSDLNADRAALLRERNTLDGIKFRLNELLSRDPSTEFSVTEVIPLNRDINRDVLYTQLMNDNSELELARMQQRIADLETRKIRGERFPEISFTSGYSFNRNRNDGGFVRFNETTGFSVGVTARVSIFDGFNTNRRVENAKINQKSSDLQLEQSKIRLETRFFTLFSTYQNNLELVDLEQENLQNAEQTLDVALERFRLGSISSLELREAQRSFLTAENRLIEAKFEAKIAETELFQLSGDLGSVLRN